VPLNNTAIHLALDALDETATSGVKFVGIHTLTDPGTGATANAGEATGGSPAYARIAATWGAAASLVKSNTNTFTFDVPAGTYGFFTLWNTSTLNSGTQYLGYIPFGGANAIKGFYSVDTTLTNDQLLSPGHGMSNGDRVMLFNVFGDALSTGLTEGTIYFVVNAATDTFKVSTTSVALRWTSPPWAAARATSSGSSRRRSARRVRSPWRRRRWCSTDRCCSPDGR
jgi:hypothetical protein